MRVEVRRTVRRRRRAVVEGWGCKRERRQEGGVDGLEGERMEGVVCVVGGARRHLCVGVSGGGRGRSWPSVADRASQ